MENVDAVLDGLVETARREGRDALLEPEGYRLLAALGIAVPRHVVVPATGAGEEAWAGVPGAELVVKVVDAAVLHKSDVGGVRVVARDRVAATLAGMAARLDVARSFLVCERVPYDPSPGGELLLGARWTEDFGPVVTLALGGVYAEHLAAHLRPDGGAVLLSPALSPAARERALEGRVVPPLVTGALRGQPPRLGAAELEALLDRWLALAESAMPARLAEIEVNPLVPTAAGPVALDVLARLSRAEAAGDRGRREPMPPRPRAKLARLLVPRSAAVMGVSRRLNPGRIILRNMLAEGFDRDRLYVVKPGCDEIEGCRCVPRVASLPEPVDLLVMSVSAEQAPAVLEEVLASRRAEGVVLIPGGLGESRGSGGRARRIRAALAASRESDWGGPVVNGGNCLGIRSRPGRYDTLFIPRHKLRFPAGSPAPLALLSQSGAFAVARASQLWSLDPRYLVSIGNQLDLTVGDYLRHLADDPEVRVFGCYVEGFQPLDGLAWLRAAQELAAAGRPVVLYRAGRTAAGAGAAASHTAAVAGDEAVTRELARAAGVVLADTIADFDDLVRLFCRLDPRPLRGRRLGVLSNAGFECVAAADRLGGLELADLATATRARLTEILTADRVEGIVDVHNPLDVTPILGDEAFAEAARTVLVDPGVDLGLVGCVPLTGALQTLPAGPEHDEDVAARGSVVDRLAGLWAGGGKPWVAALDGGPLYDPAARRLERRGVPTLRTIDRALGLLGRVVEWRLEWRGD